MILVNGRVSDRSAPRYRRLRCFFAEVFDCFAAMLVQSELDRQRLLDAGAPADRVRVAGSVKFDVAPPAEAALETARSTLAAAGVGAVAFAIDGIRGVLIAVVAPMMAIVALLLVVSYLGSTAGRSEL